MYNISIKINQSIDQSRGGSLSAFSFTITRNNVDSKLEQLKERSYQWFNLWFDDSIPHETPRYVMH